MLICSSSDKFEAFALKHKVGEEDYDPTTVNRVIEQICCYFSWHQHAKGNLFNFTSFGSFP